MNNEYPIFMQKIAPKSDFLYVQCTMYDVRLMYDMVLGTIYNRMTLDKIKYQMSIVNYQLSKYVATIIMRSSMCLEWGLLALARRTYSSYLPPATIRCGSIASSTNQQICGGPEANAKVLGSGCWERRQRMPSLRVTI